MTSPAKLYAKLLDNPGATISFRDFERLLAAFGFVLDRSKGSHRAYLHPGLHRPLIVQPRGADAKNYQVRDFLDKVRELGATLDR